MTMGKPLATFAQLSDLHLGLPTGGAGSGSLDARVEQVIRLHPWLDGWLGHHHAALEDIVDFVERLRGEGHPCHIITTGDLTRNGHPAQYALAALFLGAKLPPRVGGIGLSAPDWQELAVPGNHDHWPGANVVLGGPRTLTRLLFGHLPSRVGLTLADGRVIEFVALNTDADVATHGSDRLLARGSFAKHMAGLARRAAANPAPTSGRVLLMHHSLAFSDPTKRGILEIDGPSRARLSELIVDEDISVILCGHLHTPACTTLRVAGSRGVRSVLEARCGTSAMREAHPPQWQVPASRALRRNSLLVHRVEEEEGRLRWRTWICRRWPDAGFGPPPGMGANARPPDADHPLA